MKQVGTFKPGDVVGPYAIAGLIGVGFMGEVFRAVHRDTGEVVALKCLQVRHLDNPDLVERARREAAALCAIRHANIVYVHEAGVTEGGVVWMAMELLAGRSLRRVVKEHGGGMPLSLALYYACEIADGVDAAHEHSIVHRDLKPENVHVTEKNEIRVLDLGTAKFFGHDMETTGRAQVFGTVPYMSPEHLAGERVDARTDVYALGMMLYEMIAGVHPFKPYFESMLELGRAQLFQMPRPLFEVVPGLPGYAWSLVEKAIAKDREQRHMSMSEFARAIRRVRRRIEEESRASGDEGGIEVTLRRTPSGPTPDPGVERAVNGGANSTPVGGFRHLAETLRIEPKSGIGERHSSPSWGPPAEQPFATPPGGGSPQRLGPFGTQVIPAELRSAIAAMVPASIPPERPVRERGREPSASLPNIPNVAVMAPTNAGVPPQARGHESSATLPNTAKVVVTGPSSSSRPVPTPARVREAEVRGSAPRWPEGSPSGASKESGRGRWLALLVSLSLALMLCIGVFGYLRSRRASSGEAGGLIAPPVAASVPAPVPAAPAVSASAAAPQERTAGGPESRDEPVAGGGVSEGSPAPRREPKEAQAAGASSKSAPQASAAGRSEGSPAKAPRPTQTPPAKPKSSGAAPSPTNVQPLFDF
jgi:serine/threonine-protein kinase